MENLKREYSGVPVIDMTSSNGNDGTEACMRVQKLYDWVKLQSIQNFPVFVPAEDLQAIKDAINAGNQILIKSSIDLEASTVQVIKIEDVDAECKCVALEKILILNIEILNVDTGLSLSKFSRTIQLFDSSRVCIPSPLGKSNIIVAIVGAEALTLSTAPVDGVIVVEISTCQDIQVVLDVVAKIKITGYCTSHAGASCLGTVACDAGNESYPGICSGSCTAVK